MKKILILMTFIIIILSSCSNQIKPVEIVETEFDLMKAELVMKRSWKPISEMTNESLETKPDLAISSKEEFFDKYDFTYMSEQSGMRMDMYNSLVTLDANGEEVKNEQGNIVFNKGKYIPTIYEKKVFIKNAYIRETIYNEEYSSLNSVELVVEESSNYKEGEPTSGFNRESVFKKNDNDKWILDHIQGTASIWWER